MQVKSNTRILASHCNQMRTASDCVLCAQYVNRSIELSQSRYLWIDGLVSLSYICLYLLQYIGDSIVILLDYNSGVVTPSDLSEMVIINLVCDREYWWSNATTPKPLIKWPTYLNRKYANQTFIYIYESSLCRQINYGATAFCCFFIRWIMCCVYYISIYFTFLNS